MHGPRIVSDPSLEIALARLYVDPRFRARFVADPLEAAREMGLADDAARAFAAIDRDGLDLFCAALERKRAHVRLHSSSRFSPRRPGGRRGSDPLIKERPMSRFVRFARRVFAAFLVFAASCDLTMAQEVEPNNSCSTAQLVGTIVPPARVTGQLDPLDATAQTDVDFSFLVAEPGLRLRLTVSPNQRAGLFDEDCDLVAASDPFSENTIDFEVPPSGGFIVAVADLFDNAFTGNGFFFGGTWELAFAIQPPSVGSISGRLVDALSGEALMGGAPPFARVELRRCRQGSCFEFVNSQPADARGGFRFELDTRGRRIEIGDFELRAFADEFETVVLPLSVGAAEALDVGDVALIPPPILFTDVAPCAALLPQGGVCAYSVRIRNNTIGGLSGLAHSIVDVGFGASRFEAGTRSNDATVRRARVAIASEGSQLVTFAFGLPSFVANGTVICADVALGLDPSPLFNPARRATLFCMSKGDSGFRVMSPLETHAELERRRSDRGGAPPIAD